MEKKIIITIHDDRANDSISLSVANGISMVQLIGYLDIAKHTVNNKLDKGMTKPKTIEDLLKGYPDNKLNIRAFNAFYSVNNIDKPLKDVDIEYLKTIRGMGGATIKNVIETIENL